MAKGVLTLVPLPKKIRYMLGYLSYLFQNLLVITLRCGYYNKALSAESQMKSDFVTLIGKFEFKKVPFGFAQAPAYFHRLINEILGRLDISFGYLSDI